MYEGSGTNGLCGSLCFSLLSPTAVLFSEVLRVPLCLCLSPCQLGGFPGCGFLSYFVAPFQEGWAYPDSFFFFPLFYFSFFSLLFYPVM